MTPAAGQGSLALEARRADPDAAAAAISISDHDALVELTAERAAVATLKATCHTPVGICARLGGEELTMHGFAGLPDGSEWVRDRVTGDPEQPAALGQALAERLLAAGAGPILERAEGLRLTAARSGVVYLVGAGPGDPGLMTLRALELIASAEVVLHDRLIPPGALDEAREDAELIYVGKRPGSPQMPQEEIERLMVDRARAGRSLVRLKGGDPFVFGRGGEEAEALAAAGVPFEVVPGVTAGVAAPAYAGIPLTHRDDASAVAFVTAHEDPGKDGALLLDWEALARFPGTLVLYMGVKRLPEVAERLVEAGRDAGEPAAAVERGTMPGQRTVTASLADLPAAASAAGLHPPAIVLIGPVAARRETIGWLERRPLHGLRVVVTRARAQASGLAATLRALGAEVIELPAIRIVSRLDSAEVRDAVAVHPRVRARLPDQPERGQAAVRRARRGGTRRARARQRDGRRNRARHRGGARRARDRRRRRAGASRSPRRWSRRCVDFDVADRPVLVARAAEARDVLPDALRERGAKVDVVALYETVAEEPDPAAIEAARDADYVTFTSSSTVRNLVAAVGDGFPAHARVVSIGPVTSDAARAGRARGRRGGRSPRSRRSGGGAGRGRGRGLSLESSRGAPDHLPLRLRLRRRVRGRLPCGDRGGSRRRQR